MEVLLEGRAEAAAELYCSAPTSLSLRSGQPCTAVSVATAAWLLGQDAAEMAERTLQCVCVCVCVCVCARVCVSECCRLKLHVKSRRWLRGNMELEL